MTIQDIRDGIVLIGGAIIGVWYLWKQSHTKVKKDNIAVKHEELQTEVSNNKTVADQWKRYAMDRDKMHDGDVKRLESRVDMLQERLSKLAEEEQKCQIKTARLEEQSKFLIGVVIEKHPEFEEDLKRRGLSMGSNEYRPLEGPWLPGFPDRRKESNIVNPRRRETDPPPPDFASDEGVGE